MKTPSLILDVRTHESKIGNREVSLAPKEWAIAKMLGENPGTVFSRE